MKEKITKDIIMKVGQGLVRIPGDKVMEYTNLHQPERPSKPSTPTDKQKSSAKSDRRS